ncbi:glycosyltransferase [Bacteroides gallinaceum]|nr:glycosyltransferase [Bacteroides gallinaceum]MBM6944092.1 glycosyltransferase [Bacteroides gallinaceum]
MRILSVGSLLGVSNTCVQRTNAMKNLGHKVDEVNTTAPYSFIDHVINRLFRYHIPVYHRDKTGANKKIIDLVNKNNYDIVWIDKGLTIYPTTLKYIRRKLPNIKIVNYSPDTMSLRHNQSQQYLESIPFYDILFTTKSFMLDDMRKLGAKNIQFVNNAYESTFHYPRTLSTEEKKELGDDVGFVGYWEKKRCKSILYLVDNGIHVKVFGDFKWNKYRNYSPNLTIIPHLLKGEDYAKSFQAFKISLCFLRKMNKDYQTTRTMEIPACGGFMLAERTNEHLSLFDEGKEADFFDDDEELLRKCIYYLQHEDKRKAIAAAGLRRCINSGYSNINNINHMLSIVQSLN